MEKPFILVVDDNKITTKLLKRYLETNGYQAGEAYDGVECLEKVEERIPDAIILDVMMPRLDGYETVKRLKSQVHTKDIPVVIVTALNDVANQIKSVDAGADDFLSKPIEEKLLIAKTRFLSKFSLEMKKNKILLDLIQKIKNKEIELNGKSPEEMLQEALNKD